MARLLTTATTIQCPHGAPAVLSTANGRVSAGARVLLESDTHSVVGCTHELSSGARSPCTTIEWSAGATKVKVGGTAPLFESSLGQCKSAAGLIQGTALIVTTQHQVSAV